MKSLKKLRDFISKVDSLTPIKREKLFGKASKDTHVLSIRLTNDTLGIPAYSDCESFSDFQEEDFDNIKSMFLTKSNWSSFQAKCFIEFTRKTYSDGKIIMLQHMGTNKANKSLVHADFFKNIRDKIEVVEPSLKKIRGTGKTSFKDSRNRALSVLLLPILETIKAEINMLFVTIFCYNI